MKTNIWKVAVFTMCFSVLASAVAAQYVVPTADQVEEYISGGRAAIVDVRSAEEYREGHIPGAVNIPAERVFGERSRLPRDKATPLIFYCRGIG